MEEEIEITARLENWSVHKAPSVGVIVFGNIFGDKKGRFKDRTLIHTSLVRNFRGGFKKGDVVETLNSNYLLGEEYEEYSE